MIVYDTNILIYALEGTSPWAHAAQSVVWRGEQEGAVLSVLAWQELMTGLVLRGNKTETKLAKILRGFEATTFVPVTQAITERAIELTRTYGKKLYGYDAIHIATAMEYQASSFITNDRVLLNIELKEIEVRGL